MIALQPWGGEKNSYPPPIHTSSQQLIWLMGLDLGIGPRIMYAALTIAGKILRSLWLSTVSSAAAGKSVAPIPNGRPGDREGKHDARQSLAFSMDLTSRESAGMTNTFELDICLGRSVLGIAIALWFQASNGELTFYMKSTCTLQLTFLFCFCLYILRFIQQ